MSPLVTELLPVIVNSYQLLYVFFFFYNPAPDIDLLISNFNLRIDTVDHHLFTHVERSVSRKQIS